MSANDRQVGGDHYRSKEIQPWDAMEVWLTPEEFAGFLKGNAIKYLARKKGVHDIEKAHHYLEKWIEVTRARQARDDVLPKHPPAAAEARPPREDVQSVSGWDSGRVVLSPSGGYVGRVQVDPENPEVERYSYWTDSPTEIVVGLPLERRP